MTKPSPPSQPFQPSPKSKDEKVTQDTATDETVNPSASPNNDNADNTEKGEDMQEDKKGGGFADLMGDEGSLQFSAPEESAEQGEDGEGWKQQAEEWKDKAQRAIAEEANTRNRLQRERAELLKFAAAPLANEILQVADILNSAIKSLPDTWQDNKELKNFIDGLHMTEQSLQAALQKHHIRQIGKVGDKFDATYHQAVSVSEDKTAEPNHILEVLQPGYMLHDRILRPA